MIKVGINENVYLGTPILQEDMGKVSVDLPFSSGEAAGAGPVDKFAEEAEDSDGYTELGGNITTLKIFPPYMPDEQDKNGNDIAPARRADDVYKNIMERKNLFTQFLLCYMTKDKFKLKPFTGLDVNMDNHTAKLLNEDVVASSLRNLGKQFVEAMTAHADLANTPLRMICRRQSKAKHYARLRDFAIREYPVVEVMAIPKEASKLKWMDYEINGGLNSSAPAQAESKPTGDTPTGDAVFGGDAGADTAGLDDVLGS